MSARRATIILMELAHIFEEQKSFLAEELFYERFSMWEELTDKWDALFLEFRENRGKQALTSQEEDQIKEIVDKHELLCSQLKIDLNELRRQMLSMQQQKRAVSQYEHTIIDSVFYDERK